MNNSATTKDDLLREIETLREMLMELELEKAQQRSQLATSRRSLGMFQRVFEASGEGILILNERLRIQEANPSFCDTLGYAKEEVVGRTPMEFADGDTYLFLEENLAAMPAESYRNYEGVFKTKDGEPIPMLVHRSTLYGEQDAVLGYACFLHDMTEMKQVQAMREDVERIARHDLKSYLLSTVYIPRILKKSANLNEEQLELLTSLEESGTRMMEMINRSMDLYKMERGTFQLETQPVNLPPLICKSFNALGELLQDKQLSLALYLDDTQVGPQARFLIPADELLCSSLFGNLFKNAAEASPNGSTISVRLRETPPWREIEVHNPGAIPMEIRARFFEKYATAGKHHGMGLGAYTIRLIAHTHGAQVSFTTSDAEGTTIRLLWPEQAPEKKY